MARLLNKLLQRLRQGLHKILLAARFSLILGERQFSLRGHMCAGGARRLRMDQTAFGIADVDIEALFKQKKRAETNSSIMPACVASVPITSVVHRFFFSALLCTKGTIPVIADNRLASVNGRSGCVSHTITPLIRKSSVAPSATTDNVVPSFS